MIKGGNQVGRRSEKKKEARSVVAPRRMDLDFDAIRRGELIEIRGRTRVDVGGVREICEYLPEQIVLTVEKGRVKITGERLTCVFYRRGAAAVEGKIRLVEFLE